MSSAVGLKQLGVAPSHWQHIQQLSCLRSFTAASIAPKRLDHQRAVAAQAEVQGATTASQTADAAAGAPVAAYVHLPFCKRKCFYCDFPVEAVGLNVQKTSEFGTQLTPTERIYCNGSSDDNMLLVREISQTTY
jgi:hypothetical protein